MPEKLYEVEKIVDHREGHRGSEFLVRWANYASASDTWEPADNLQNCEDIIENYMKTMDEKPKSQRKTRRSTRLSQAFKLDESQQKEEPQITQSRKKREPAVAKTARSSTTKTKTKKSRGKNIDRTSTIEEESSTRRYSTRLVRSTSRQVDISDDEGDIMLSTSKPLTETKQLSEAKFRKGGLFSSTPFASEKEPLKKALGFDSYNLRRTTVTTRVTRVTDKTNAEDDTMGGEADDDMVGEAESDDDEIIRAAQKKKDMDAPAEAPPPTESSAQWMEIGWKEVALATVISGIGVLGYVCYVTDYCSYC